MVALLSAEQDCKDEILHHFEQDGVVALHDVLPPMDIERLKGGISQQLAGMVGASPFDDGDEATLHTGLNTWRTIAPVRAVACGARLAALAACLLDDTHVRFLSDRTLVRSPASVEDAAFAPDLLCGAFDDDDCLIMSLPLYEMTTSRGQMNFLAGAHRGDGVARVASVEGAPGLVIAHHPRTPLRLGNAGNLIALLQLRYARADAALVATGAPPDDAMCPRVWPLH